MSVVKDEDFADMHGYLGHRILSDGRILLAIQRFYNTQLSVTSPEMWPYIQDDNW